MQKSRLMLSLLTFLIKNPKALLVALLFGGLFYSYELFYARDAMSFMGVPKALEVSSTTWTRIFRNRAYMVGYSDLRGNPLWVVYKLTLPQKNAPHLKRPENFSSDWRNFGMIDSGDYTSSGYDRGHMAPNRAIALLYGKEAQYETFLMTNITPQKPSLNQKLWQTLEEIELEEFTQKFHEVWVYTGPLFDRQTVHLKHSRFVEVPDAFYKIYVGISNDGKMEAIAFIVPQNAKATDSIEKYSVSIDEVERRSGFDFFHLLDDPTEENLEKKIETHHWF